MNRFKVGDVVWFLGEKWIIEMIICARIYIRNKARVLNIPRFNEVKPIKREYAILGDA